MTHHTRLPSAVLIDGASHPVFPLAPDPTWPGIAKAKGFTFVSRVTDRYRCVLRCHACGTKAVVRINVLRDHQPLCHTCIYQRRAAAARALGAELIAADHGSRHYGHYRLRCGHVVRRQYLRVEKAAAGGHAIDCESCREIRYGTAARAFGWTLDGPARGRRPGYRSYRHGCGHAQDVSIGNMAWGDASCGACAQNWAGKPSYIYLFRIDLPGLPVVKMGYSARPAKRLRHQLGIPRGVGTEILRVMLLSSGNAAVREESACHRAMRERHTHLIVPKSMFGDAINTQGEIYHASALPILHALLDEVATRHPVESSGAEVPLPAMPAARNSHRDAADRGNARMRTAKDVRRPSAPTRAACPHVTADAPHRAGRTSRRPQRV